MTAGVAPAVSLAVVEAVLAERFPKFKLPAIAAEHGLRMPDLQAVLQHAGYPDDDAMRRALPELRRLAEAHRIADNIFAPPHPDQVQPDGSVIYELADEHPRPVLVDQLARIRVDDLLPDPNNLRPAIDSDDPDILDLAASIDEAGLLQPIVARRGADDQLYVVMGHRRLAAVRRLGWAEVECILRDAMSPEDVIAAMLIENGQRTDLDPIAEARGLARLQQLMGGASESAVARRIGRSAVFVRSRILLLSLDTATQERVRRGELAIGAAGSAAAVATGRTGTAGVDRNWHLGPRHPLAGPARARCEDAGHVAGRRLGAIACGECWEKAIREDERTNGPDPEGDYCSQCGAFVEDPHRDDCPYAVDDEPSLTPAFSGASS